MERPSVLAMISADAFRLTSFRSCETSSAVHDFRTNVTSAHGEALAHFGNCRLGPPAKQPDLAELSSLASLKNRGRLLMFQTRSPASRASGVISPLTKHCMWPRPADKRR